DDAQPGKRGSPPLRAAKAGAFRDIEMHKRTGTGTQLSPGVAAKQVARRRRKQSVLCVALLAIAACTQPPPPAPPAPQVTVAKPIEKEIVEWDEYTARLEAVNLVEVRPRVGGYLNEVRFQEGAIVEAGQVLFVIDPRPYQATLKHAEADVELAKARLELAQKR